jgi:chorismate dehydratase
MIMMSTVRLGAVGYLNARPCVVGLDRDPRFELRFDLPSRCAALLHEGSIDVGLVPSIEYLRHPEGAGVYCIVPDVAIASDGPVASVALYTKRQIRDVRSIALDTSSRTSVALTRVLCGRIWRIDPVFEPSGPDLAAMLERADAALLIGDAALFVDHEKIRLEPAAMRPGPMVRPKPDGTVSGAAVQIQPDVTADRLIRGVEPETAADRSVEKIDLGATWKDATGLPFVYAFWAGWPHVLGHDHVRALQAARNAGVDDLARVAREYVRDADERAIGARYLRDNIRYRLGEREQAGLELFYRYASELELVPPLTELRFYRT